MGRYFKEVWESLSIFALSAAGVSAIVVLVSYIRCGRLECDGSWLSFGDAGRVIAMGAIALAAASFAFAGLEMAENAPGPLRKAAWVVFGLALAAVMWVFFYASWLAIVGATLD